MRSWSPFAARRSTTPGCARRSTKRATTWPEMSTVADPQPEERVELELEGMTCASCAARIERKLNKLAGVQATVNFATERAAVRYQRDRVAVGDLLALVEATGYRAREHCSDHPDERAHGA